MCGLEVGLKDLCRLQGVASDARRQNGTMGRMGFAGDTRRRFVPFLFAGVGVGCLYSENQRKIRYIGNVMVGVFCFSFYPSLFQTSR